LDWKPGDVIKDEMPQWQVYKGVRGGVQEVAVKQLRNAGAADLDKFVEVRRLIQSGASAC